MALCASHISIPFCRDLVRDKGPVHIILQNKYININCTVQNTTFIATFWCSGPEIAGSSSALVFRIRFFVQVTIYRRLRIGRDVHLEESESYDFSRETEVSSPLTRKDSIMWGASVTER